MEANGEGLFLAERIGGAGHPFRQAYSGGMSYAWASCWTFTSSAPC